MNNVNLAGRVAKDPETRGAVTTLIVATDRVKLDARFDEGNELVENGVLQGDREREDAVEPALDRRQIVDHAAVGPFDPEPG